VTVGARKMRTRSAAGLGFAMLLTLATACGGGGAAPASPAAPSPTPTPVVSTGSATVAGKAETILIDDRGLTLYYFLPDKGGKITCTTTMFDAIMAGNCLALWPPLILPTGTTVPHASGIPGRFAMLTNPDGKGMQILYNGWPLYFFSKDTKPGDTNGQGLLGQWFVATPNLAPSS
jgi:predicted lipoprotein with Yx(FWY)xxD motif